MRAGATSAHGCASRSDGHRLRPSRVRLRRPLEPASIAEESLQLDARVSTHDPLRIESRLAKLQSAADCNLRGSPHRPVELGCVDIERGTADVGGSRFTSVSGSIDFPNATPTDWPISSGAFLFPIGQAFRTPGVPRHPGTSAGRRVRASQAGDSTFEVVRLI